MRIENAIKQIYSLPGGWVRVDRIRRIPGGLELCLGIYGGRRGRKVQALGNPVCGSPGVPN